MEILTSARKKNNNRTDSSTKQSKTLAGSRLLTRNVLNVDFVCASEKFTVLRKVRPIFSLFYAEYAL